MAVASLGWGGGGGNSGNGAEVCVLRSVMVLCGIARIMILVRDGWEVKVKGNSEREGEVCDKVDQSKAPRLEPMAKEIFAT